MLSLARVARVGGLHVHDCEISSGIHRTGPLRVKHRAGVLSRCVAAWLAPCLLLLVAVAWVDAGRPEPTDAVRGAPVTVATAPGAEAGHRTATAQQEARDTARAEGASTAPAGATAAPEGASTAPDSARAAAARAAAAADQKAGLDLWLGREYERVRRFTDAEAAYVRALSAASDSVRAEAQSRIASILERKRGWFGRNVGTPFGSAWSAVLTTVFTILIGVVIALLLFPPVRKGANWWGERRGKHRLTIEPFTRHLPEDVGLGIEDTIVEMHGRMNTLLRPLGILWSSDIQTVQGSARLPVISSKSFGGEIAQLVESFGNPPLAQGVRDALSGAGRTEFRVGGVLQAIGSRVQLTARLEKNGKTVKTWSRRRSKFLALEAERDLAHDIIRALLEQTSDETGV